MDTFLDLRPGGELSVDDAKIITSLERSLGDEYTSYVGDLVDVNKVEGLQWFLKSTCRNTYDSVIYDSMCRLALLEYRLKGGVRYSFILVENLFLSKVVCQLLDQYDSKARVEISSKSYCGIRLIKNIFFNFSHCLGLWIVSRFFDKGRPADSIILLDAFFLDKGGLYDHYYPGLEENLPNNILNKVWFSPTFLHPKYPWRWLGIFRRISKFKKNIILKEGWLTFNDYLFALKESLLITSKIKKIPKWRGLDVSSIIKHDLLSDTGSFSISYAILTYRSFARFKEADIKIDTLFDWFENQTIDRATYLGVRECYPDTFIKGYLGFVPEGYYVGLSPSKYEKNGGTLPDKLYVIGGAYVDIVKKYISNLEVEVAPAFRFYSTIKFKKGSYVQSNIVLLALPMQMRESISMVKLVSTIKLDNGYKLLVKPHPTHSIEKLKKHIPDLKDMNFTVETLTNIFQLTRLLITSASSVAMEAVVCGIPVAILGNRSGPTINPLTRIVSDKYWSVCYTTNDIAHLLSFKYKPTLGGQLDMHYYFQDVTQDKVASMFMLEKLND